MFKKLNTWIIKIIIIIGVIIATFFTVHSSITMSSSTSGLVNSALNKAAAQSGNSNVRTGVQLFQALGLDNAILNQLPKKIEIKTSLSKFNATTSSFQQNGQIGINDLGLKNDTDQEKIINDFLIKIANDQLDKYENQINKYAQYYRLLYYVILLLYIIATLMILFGIRSAIIPILIASVGSYELMQLGSMQLTSVLHKLIYSGIKIDLDSGFLISITISIIVSIFWLFGAKIGKKKKSSVKLTRKKYKHAAN
ncbi:hypothetical protein J2Z60_000937 [Lactobacillus colini]|uniref:Integral membrane protein n=1 Tax=Lactobacillus colini TaxID=1819254 RepID=A0ABS4MDJ9_9LACO|nr:hypothetical protein [Lactobacillus colini]MBP2057765.1 hypothetical protein [Lactobacillus colini]